MPTLGLEGSTPSALVVSCTLCAPGRLCCLSYIPPDIPTVKVKNEFALVAGIVLVIIHDGDDNVRCPDRFPFSKSLAGKHPQSSPWDGRRCQPHAAHRRLLLIVRSSSVLLVASEIVVVVVIFAVQGRRWSDSLLLVGGDGKGPKQAEEEEEDRHAQPTRR